jgi:hypothetical protein
MRIVLLITLFEGLILTALLLSQRRNKHVHPANLIGSTPGSQVVEGKTGAARWAFINESQFEGQANDRRPMLSSLAATAGSPAARRSSARRAHQLDFKKWSTERRD